ncbi:MAG: hypothetical protein QM500_19520 [Methylococcales bacterium]
MSNRLPKDLPGGWEFKEPFKAVPFKQGQIWRKLGPIDAFKIVRVMMPGHPEHDGASNGLSVRFTAIGSRGVSWQRRTWFKLGNEHQIYHWLKSNGYAPVE